MNEKKREMIEKSRRLSDQALLTQRQAEAYVLRELEGFGREEAAERMGVSANVVDKHLRAARDKVSEAEATLEVLEELRER